MDSNFSEFAKAVGGSAENLFRAFVEDMPGGFFAYRADESERILYMNRAVLRIFGCETFEEFSALTGDTFHGMVHPDDLDGVEQSIKRQIIDGGDNTDFVEYRIRHKDGSAHRVVDYGRYTETDALGGIFYVFIADDNDRIKRRMERLERANEALLKLSAREGQYRRALLHDALFFCEVSLTDDRIINAVTQRGDTDADTYPMSDEIADGASYTELVRRSSERIDQNDAAEYLEFFDRERLTECCEKGAVEQEYDRRVNGEDGKTRFMHYAVMLGKNDKEVFALITVKDITAQHERLNRLRVSLDRTQSAARAKGEFLANMSHDITTQLNAVLGFVDLINLDDKAKSAEYLDRIRASGELLLSTASRALEITNIAEGRAALAETEGDIFDMLEETERAVLPAMCAKAIAFKVDSALLRHGFVLADFTRIKELLIQLLDNAARFTDRGGRVTLRADEGARTDGRVKYAFTVEDNGCGISDECMEHLFEPFTHGEAGGNTGSGLGMTLVKRLAELMSGEISVNSREGKGSRVTFTVMLKQTETKEQSAAKKRIPLKGRRILLAEDNEINSEIAEAMLTKNGFVVETVPDGAAALELLREVDPDRFDLVLMDIQMPRMNGCDAAKAIRALDTSAAGIPIIALSANTSAEDRKNRSNREWTRMPPFP